MLNNYFLICEQAKYLDKNISGSKITRIFTSEKNKLIIETESWAKHFTLEFSAIKNFNYLILKSHSIKPKKNYASLLQQTYNGKILKISIFNEDRIICFELDNKLEIFFTFFSDKANIFVSDERRIISSFKSSDEFEGKYFETVLFKKKPETIIPETYDTRAFFKRMYPAFGEIYYREVLHNAKLKDTDALDGKNAAALNAETRTLVDKFKEPGFFLYSDKNNFYASLLKLETLKHLEVKDFENSNELINEYVKLKYCTDKITSIKERSRIEFRKKISQTESKLAGLQHQLTESENSVKFKTMGEVILQNFDKIKKGDSEFIYEGQNTGKMNIPLKENFSPSENAQRYFEKYKNQKNSIETLKNKIVRLEAEMKKILNNYEESEKKTDLKAVLKEEKRHQQNKKDETSAFRKFVLSDKYEVWVGKNSASNDLLTTKYASPNDLWFHVKGAGGSHTILKSSNKKESPGKEIVNIAASIAAYYSKARNASSVPVAYCEKKFVKKRKGMKEGSVMMEREKVLFVRPELPEAD